MAWFCLGIRQSGPFFEVYDDYCTLSVTHTSSGTEPDDDVDDVTWLWGHQTKLKYVKRHTHTHDEMTRWSFVRNLRLGRDI